MKGGENDESAAGGQSAEGGARVQKTLGYRVAVQLLHLPRWIEGKYQVEGVSTGIPRPTLAFFKEQNYCDVVKHFVLASVSPPKLRDHLAKVLFGITMS